MNYECSKCNYTTCKKSNYDKHLLTTKHQNGILLNKKTTKPIKNASDHFCCKYCSKEYKARNSLWYHEKKCNNTEGFNEIVEYEHVDSTQCPVHRRNMYYGGSGGGRSSSGGGRNSCGRGGGSGGGVGGGARM